MPFKFTADLGWLKIEGDAESAIELNDALVAVAECTATQQTVEAQVKAEVQSMFCEEWTWDIVTEAVLELLVKRGMVAVPSNSETFFAQRVKGELNGLLQEEEVQRRKEVADLVLWRRKQDVPLTEDLADKEVASARANGEIVDDCPTLSEPECDCPENSDDAPVKDWEQFVATPPPVVPVNRHTFERLAEVGTEEDPVTEEPEPEPEPEPDIPVALLPAEPAPEPEKPTQLGNPVPFPDGANLPWRCQLVLKHIKAGLTIEQACEIEGWKQSTALQYLSETRKRLKRPDIAFAKSQRQAPARSGPLKVAWEKVVQILSEAAEGKTPEQIADAMGTSIFALSVTEVVQVLDRYSVTLAKMRAAWGRDPVSFREAKIEAQARVINDGKDGKVVFGP